MLTRFAPLALRLSAVRQVLRAARQSAQARAHAHGRATVPVRSLRQELHAEESSHAPLRGAPGVGTRRGSQRYIGLWLGFLSSCTRFTSFPVACRLRCQSPASSAVTSARTSWSGSGTCSPHTRTTTRRRCVRRSPARRARPGMRQKKQPTCISDCHPLFSFHCVRFIAFPLGLPRTASSSPGSATRTSRPPTPITRRALCSRPVCRAPRWRRWCRCCRP